MRLEKPISSKFSRRSQQNWIKPLFANNSNIIVSYKFRVVSEDAQSSAETENGLLKIRLKRLILRWQNFDNLPKWTNSF